MKFSVVLVNYASWPLTLRCIESLFGTGYEGFEVVVVDNDAGPVPEMRWPVNLIRNPVNVGFARACNRGIDASTGEYVVLVNPDTTVERDFFARFETLLGSNSDVGVAGPRVLDESGRVQLSARKEVGAVSGLLGRTSLLTRLFPRSRAVRRLFPAAAAPEGPATVDWVSGACMVLRRRVLEEVGGLDGRFFMYFEDADLCRRTRASGWLVLYLPGVSVTHRAGGSSRSSARAVWHLHRSAFLYHRKHGPHGPLSLYTPVVAAGLALRVLAKLAASYLGGR